MFPFMIKLYNSCTTASVVDWLYTLTKENFPLFFLLRYENNPFFFSQFVPTRNSLDFEIVSVIFFCILCPLTMLGSFQDDASGCLEIVLDRNAVDNSSLCKSDSKCSAFKFVAPFIRLTTAKTAHTHATKSLQKIHNFSSLKSELMKGINV